MENNSKILIIGQAPPAKPQGLPYDSTQLYDWLKEVGVSKEAAQELFIFEALVPAFTGRNNTNSGHKKPGKQDVLNHWPVLEAHLQTVYKVILLGAVAADYYDRMPRTWSCSIQELYLLHPSRRNVYKFRLQKETILSQLKTLINGA